MPNHYTATSSRNPIIDLLRGLAILAIITHHFQLAYPLENGLLTTIIPKSFYLRFINNGYYGVVILFVVSGYLITKRLLKQFSSLAQIDLTQFYIQRISRILPSLLLALTIVSVLRYLGLAIFDNTADGPGYTLTLISVLSFWHNNLLIHYGWFNYCLNVYWSLSITETFYFAFPIFV